MKRNVRFYLQKDLDAVSPPTMNEETALANVYRLKNVAPLTIQSMETTILNCKTLLINNLLYKIKATVAIIDTCSYNPTEGDILVSLFEMERYNRSSTN